MGEDGAERQLMRSRLHVIYLRLAALLALTVGGWFAAADRFRVLETTVSLRALAAVGLGGDRVLRLDGDLVLLLPDGGGPIAAQVSRSCSALAALLALAALSLVVMSGSPARRLGGLVASVTLLFVANTFRLAASIYLGARFGSVGLLLFHDVAGTFFVLGYTLLGFALMLRFHMSAPRCEELRRYGDVL